MLTNRERTLAAFAKRAGASSVSSLAAPAAAGGIDRMRRDGGSSWEIVSRFVAWRPARVNRFANGDETDRRRAAAIARGTAEEARHRASRERENGG